MIKLDRPKCPEELTDELKQKLTDEFKLDKSKTVWREPFIINGIMQMSSEKCAFCECKINKEANYLHIEHFHPKKDYPDEVVDWNNLLPICGRCNSHKGHHDTKREAIVNPTIHEPKEHIYIDNFWFWGIEGTLGELTIDLLNLNDQRVSVTRFMIGRKIVNLMNKLFAELNDFDVINASARKKSILRNNIQALYSEGLPSEQYSALTATIILSFPYYEKFVNRIKELGIWNESFEIMESQIKNISLGKTMNQVIRG